MRLYRVADGGGSHSNRWPIELDQPSRDAVQDARESPFTFIDNC
jgi:hypothetical protein